MFIFRWLHWWRKAVLHWWKRFRKLLILPKVMIFGGAWAQGESLWVWQCSWTFCRLFGHFTMEAILATAFGYKVDLQKGEVEGRDELFAAVGEVTNNIGPVPGLLRILHCKCTLNRNCPTNTSASSNPAWINIFKNSIIHSQKKESKCHFPF